MNTPDKLRKPSHEDEKTPNYTLRRTVAAGATALALLGVWKGIELGTDAVSAIRTELTESDYDDHNCVNDGETVTIDPGESIWDKAGEPLAEELKIPVDKAMGILATANPNIASLGNVQPGTVVQIPDCEP